MKWRTVAISFFTLVMVNISRYTYFYTYLHSIHTMDIPFESYWFYSNMYKIEILIY